MNSNREITKNPKDNIRPPYSPDEVKLIFAWIEDGLRILKSTGKTVNYEEMCQRILDSIPTNLYIPELKSYITHWRERFYEKTSKKDRNRVFSEFIGDAYRKGLIESGIRGLTADYSEKIKDIILKNSTH